MWLVQVALYGLPACVFFPEHTAPYLRVMGSAASGDEKTQDRGRQDGNQAALSQDYGRYGYSAPPARMNHAEERSAPEHRGRAEVRGPPELEAVQNACSEYSRVFIVGGDVALAKRAVMEAAQKLPGGLGPTVRLRVPVVVLNDFVSALTHDLNRCAGIDDLFFQVQMGQVQSDCRFVILAFLAQTRMAAAIDDYEALKNLRQRAGGAQVVLLAIHMGAHGMSLGQEYQGVPVINMWSLGNLSGQSALCQKEVAKQNAPGAAALQKIARDCM